jgi:hypothetical protein
MWRRSSVVRVVDLDARARRHARAWSDLEELALEPGLRWPRMIRWGAQVDVRVLEAGEAASCAGYIAKYATKSTEVVGGLVYRLSATSSIWTSAACRADGALRVDAREPAAPPAAAAAAVRACARVPRALLHEESLLLDDLHGAATRASRSPGAPRARWRAARSMGPADAGSDPAGAVPVERGRGGLQRPRRAGRRRVAAGVGGPDRRTRGVSAQRGSIFHTANGLWAIRFRDSLGRRPQRTGFRTRREAREALEDELRRVRLGPLYRPNVTLRELTDAYVKQSEAAPSSIAFLVDNMKPALASFGDEPIGSLRVVGSRRGGRTCRRASAIGRCGRFGRCSPRRCGVRSSRRTRPCDR